MSDVEYIIERAINHFPELDAEIIRRNVPDWRAINRASQMLKPKTAL